MPTLINFIRNLMIMVLFFHAPLLTAENIKAAVTIDHQWVRESYPGQTVGAAYMTLTSQEPLELVAVSTDVADAVEIHSMSMKDGVMKMRRLTTLALEVNKPVALTPGGFHLMLFDLKKPLATGETVTFDLSFKTKNGEMKHLTVDSSVKTPDSHEEHGHHH